MRKSNEQPISRFSPKSKKRGSTLQQTLVHLILVAIVLALLFVAVVGRSSSSEIKQQLLEKQTAILIEASTPGTVLELNKENVYGATRINNLRIEGTRIYIEVDATKSAKGYPFFSKYNVTATEKPTKWLIHIDEN